MPKARTTPRTVISTKLTIENLARRFRLGPLKGRMELLQCDGIAKLCVGARNSALGKLNGQAAAADDPAHAPRLDPFVHKNDLAFPAKEDNIKRVSHEEHVYGVARLNNEPAPLRQWWRHHEAPALATKLSARRASVASTD